MHGKKLNIFCISLAAVCIAVAVCSYFHAERVQKSVTEVALSFCAEELAKSPETRSTEHLRNYLTFAKLPEAEKQILLTAQSFPESLLKKMRYFTCSESALRKLCAQIDELKDQSVAAFRLSDATSYDYSGGEKMIRALFGGVAFKKTEIEGGKRYFCSNICIDLCENDSIRFLCDVGSGSSGEQILHYFFKKTPITVEKSVTLCGIAFQTLSGEDFSAEVCKDLKSGKIFAGRIKYR